MGSVLNYIECPNCKSENCFDDYYYNSGEYYISCFDCGYTSQGFYKRDENGEYIKKDVTKEATFDNHIWEEVEIKNPFGAYKLQSKDSTGYICGSLENEEQYNTLKEGVLSDETVVSCEVSRFVNGKIEKENIV